MAWGTELCPPGLMMLQSFRKAFGNRTWNTSTFDPQRLYFTDQVDPYIMMDQNGNSREVWTEVRIHKFNQAANHVLNRPLIAVFKTRESTQNDPDHAIFGKIINKPSMDMNLCFEADELDHQEEQYKYIGQDIFRLI